MKTEVLVNQRKFNKLKENEAYQEYLIKEYTEKKIIKKRYEYSNELISFIRKKVNELNYLELAVINLRFWQNLSLTEISSALSLSYKKILELIENALEILRFKYLTEFENLKTKQQPPAQVANF